MENQNLILAIGGAGGNIIRTIYNENQKKLLNNTRYVYAYNDNLNIRLPKDSFGKDIEFLKLNAKSESFPVDVFEGVKHLFVIAGLGGYTGSTFSVYAIRKAKELNIESITIIVTTPFHFEDKLRFKIASDTIQQLREIAPGDIIISNNADLMKRNPHINFMDAFYYADLEVKKLLKR